jgi:hypothetical protein
MAPRTVYATLADGLQPVGLWDQSFADMGSLGVIPCTASGSNAITLTPIASVFSPNVLNPPNPNQLFSFVATATSTGAVTVSIAGVTGFLNLYRMDAATQAASRDIQIKVTYVVSFGSALNSAAGGFQIQSPINNEINPIISGATISNSTITTSTYNGNTWTAGSGILTIAALKTLTASNTLTFSGTDGSTLNVGTGGTLGSNAFTSTAYAPIANPTFTGTQTLTTALTTTLNGNTFTTGTYTLTGTAGKTFTFSNTLTLAGTDSTTMTFPSTNANIAALNIADQTMSGGANFTSSNQGTKSSGTFTVDCGACALQFATNNGAFTLAAPSNDGACLLLITNGASAGTITFSGFTVGSNTGDALTTTNTSKFLLSITRVNSIATYTVKALQ